jgi:hypothetical protein
MFLKLFYWEKEVNLEKTQLSGVGKTSLTLRYVCFFNFSLLKVNNEYEDATKSTVQATYLQKVIKLSDKTITLSIVSF